MSDILYQPQIKKLSQLSSLNNQREILVNEATRDMILKIYNAMSVLPDNEYNQKMIWVKIPRGAIELFGDYNELKADGEVSNRKEFEQWWIDAFPEEVAWYRVITDKYDGKHWITVCDREVFAILMFDPKSDDNVRLDLLHIAKPILELIETEVAAVVADSEAYNKYIAENLPHNRRNGKIKRSIYNSIYPNEKVMIDEKYLPMLRDFAANSDSQSAKGRITTMTVREYLKIWRLAVEAMNKIQHDGMESDVAFFESKNFNGSTILEYDMDSPEAFAKWNSLSDNWAFHRLDLQYRMITLIAQKDDLGWWFIVKADALHAMSQILRVVYALYSAGVPVNLSSAKKLVEMIDEQDFVGIQPARKCKYYTIYDGEIGSYTSLRGDENDEKVIANAVWG